MFNSPKIMGIVNVTPDSFSDGGHFYDTDKAIDHAVSLVMQGADILDIGGESTRPGADFVSEDDELCRVLPVIEGLVKITKCPISIDTRKPEVAKAAIEAGASLWNDVSGLTFVNESPSLAKQLGCDIVLMHAQGTPQTMQDNPQYKDVVQDVIVWFKERIEVCTAQGIAKEKIILDPGIGFGKTTAHNLSLIANLDQIKALGFPVLFGASRKRFIGAVSSVSSSKPEGDKPNRLGGSLAAALYAAQQGADIIRVHDVMETKQALELIGAITQEKDL